METRSDNAHLALALEKAAKIICNMKCGVCPMREDNFPGCPYACTEDIRPWRCWDAYLRELAGVEEKKYHSRSRAV